METPVLVLLARLLAKQEKATTPLAVGKYTVDTTVTLKVKGTVTKGEDEEYTPTVDIPLLATLALVLEKSGWSREVSKKMLTEAMQEALALDVEGAGPVSERVKDIEAAMVHVREITNALPDKVRAGKTAVAGMVASPAIKAA